MGVRINVDSGRPLEAKAQYSRALRFNELVLQSGTTAIDLDGNILGDSVVEQTAAIFDIAQSSMGLADGRFEDIVRLRAFVVGQDNLRPTATAIADRFQHQSFVLTLIPVSQLARPTQLIEIEIEAIDGAESDAKTLVRESDGQVDLHAIKIGQRVLLSGATTTIGDAQKQTKIIIKSILNLLETAGACPDDLVCLRIFIRDRASATVRLDDIAEELAGVRPVISIMEVTPFEHSDACVMIEAEAYCSDGTTKQVTIHPYFEKFANVLSVADQIYLSNIAPLDDEQKLVAPNDWGGQRDFCITRLETMLGEHGASLDDVINRRYFTYDKAEQNRAYGDGPAWFEATRPAALGCRIANHLHDGTVLTLEAHAIRSAGEKIEWRTLKP